MRTLVHAHQRRAVRRAVHIACSIVRESDCRLIARSAVDLSPLGMLVVAEARVLTGEPVMVSFWMPSIRRWFDLRGVVARVVHGRRPGDAGHCLGIELDPLGRESERLLRGALRNVPPPLPMREPRVDYAATVALAALS
jgi:hypothetical protein